MARFYFLILLKKWFYKLRRQFGKTKFRAVSALLAIGFIVSVSYQNCSRVRFQQREEDIRAAKSSDQVPAVVSCRNDAGKLSSRSLNITGPDVRLIQQNGDFQISGIDACENIKSIFWSAGDGTPEIKSDSTSYTHRYQRPGIYVVRADVVDHEGKVFRVYQPVTVRDNCQTADCIGEEKKQFIVFGPSLGRVNTSYTYNLVFPNGAPADSEVSPIARPSDWNFQDGTPEEHSSTSSQTHQFALPGVYDILVTSSGDYSNVQPQHHLMTVYDLESTNSPINEKNCPLEDAMISSPTKEAVNVDVPIYLNLPKCISDKTSMIDWNFGDGQSGTFDQSVMHKFANKGWYLVKADLQDQSGQKFLTLTRYIEIVKEFKNSDITSGDDTITPIDRAVCQVKGQVITSTGDLYTKKEKCGLNDIGYRNDSYKDDIVKECVEITENNKTLLVWQEKSKTPKLIQKGQCLGQPCEVPADSTNDCKGLSATDPKLLMIGSKCYIKDGEKEKFYSTQSPRGSCSDFAKERTCKNGVLDNFTAPCTTCAAGVQNFIYMICKNGCKDAIPGMTPVVDLKDGYDSPKFFLANYTETVACGNGGTQIVTYHDEAKKTCKDGQLNETTTKTKIEVSRTPCTGMSCVYNGVTYTAGQSVVFYSTSTPSAACTTVSQTRVCDGTTGNLSGLNTFSQTQCTDGCAGFGPNGAVKNSVLVAGQTITEPKTCAYGETGVVDEFEKVVDQTCQAGTVQSGEAKKGKLIKAGVCPAYKWKPLDFGACSADCGGTQTNTFQCVDEKTGANVLPERCGGIAMPIPAVRACNGDVAKTITENAPDEVVEVGSCTECPANQIGIVLDTKTYSVTKIGRCQLDSNDNKYKYVYKTEKTLKLSDYQTYCKDFVTVRCSHDSIGPAEAKNRYEWMQKCRTTVPIINEFLTKFNDVSFTGYDAWGYYQENTNISTFNWRALYPTFVDLVNDTPWIAPINPQASCDLPKNVGIGAVCVSSCATPEEQILAEIKGVTKKITFLEAIQKQVQFVKHVSKTSDLKNIQTASFEVDRWITELVDSQHDILVFKMKSGGSLKLTHNHPLMNSDGVMKQAETFKVGDQLVKENGEVDPIVSIEDMKHNGKVYNLFVRSSEPANNVVITNGYLNGTAFFQNEGGQYMNKEILRNNLVQDLVK